ncbi:MAG: serine hydrolase [Flavobacteriales bacterium]|nr:serine hydrolase [Flavobacteriales bacterium]MDG2245022.1 serine hydrolase [Flavobacteriales bacterium]
MKKLKQLLSIVLILVLGSIALLLLTGNEHILEGLPSTYLRGKSKPDIDDFEYHDVRKVEMGEPQAWPMSSRLGVELDDADLDYMQSLETTAFLVIHKDSILYEYYGEGGGKTTLSNSFSMAKSFTSMAIGAAADRNWFKPADPVSEILPRFSGGQNARLTIQQLLQMRSNINFGESYANPFGYQARTYFGDNVWEETEPYRVTGYPGSQWEYQGGNTLILSELLARKTKKPLAEWFSIYFWKRIGAENDAYWALDCENGREISFSAFFATARDFAKIGKLMLHKGKWNNTQLLSRTWYDLSIAPASVQDKEGNMVYHYGAQWWLAPRSVEPWHFSARGMRGQYIVVVPDEELVIVRLGHERDDARQDEMSLDLVKWVEMAQKLAAK